MLLKQKNQITIISPNMIRSENSHFAGVNCLHLSLLFHPSMSCTGLELVIVHHYYCYVLLWSLHLIVSPIREFDLSARSQKMSFQLL